MGLAVSSGLVEAEGDWGWLWTESGLLALNGAWLGRELGQVRGHMQGPRLLRPHECAARVEQVISAPRVAVRPRPGEGSGSLRSSPADSAFRILAWLAGGILCTSLAGCLPDHYPDIWDPDGDGHGPPEDCNIDDPAIHEGAAEVCDGVDNDCDGSVDGACWEAVSAGPMHTCGLRGGHVACWGHELGGQPYDPSLLPEELSPPWPARQPLTTSITCDRLAPSTSSIA